VTCEAQVRPGAVEHKAAQELVILPAPGEVLLFSGNQLHASKPNTSGLARYSVDFRTLSVPDLIAGRGAPLVDVYCTGTDHRKGGIACNVGKGTDLGKMDRRQIRFS
jgi:hypothetical protein